MLDQGGRGDFKPQGIISLMHRVPVQNPDGTAAMPTKPSRARKWVEQNKAIGCWSNLGVYYVRLIVEPSGHKTQAINLGVDPGRNYSGIGVQSARSTLFMAHLILPFQTVKDRMEQRRMMRRGRRGRRINRKVSYQQRAHRQKRFSNRRGHKLPPSIRANRQLELRVVKELYQLFPISTIVYEYVEAKGDKAFSPVMVGQKHMLQWLSELAPVTTQYGWKTAQIRHQLGLEKIKNKSEQSPQSHAVDGVALACSQFIEYQTFHTVNTHGHQWQGEVFITAAPFMVIRRPPISCRQLHLMVSVKGGVRRKYGGSTTRHGFRKGDYVLAEQAGRLSFGWVSGDTKSQVSISDSSWKRLGQFTAKKIQLIARATGLIVTGVKTPMSCSSAT